MGEILEVNNVDMYLEDQFRNVGGRNISKCRAGIEQNINVGGLPM